MKSFFLLLFISISFATAQTHEEQVRAVLRAQQEAWNNGDIEGYMKGYWNSDQTTFVSGGTVIRGYEEVFSRYRKRYNVMEKMGVLSFEELEVKMISDGAAVVAGIWRLERKADSPWGRFTLVVEKKPEGWRVTYDHTSVALQ